MPPRSTKPELICAPDSTPGWTGRWISKHPGETRRTGRGLPLEDPTTRRARRILANIEPEGNEAGLRNRFSNGWRICDGSAIELTRIVVATPSATSSSRDANAANTSTRASGTSPRRRSGATGRRLKTSSISATISSAADARTQTRSKFH